ncbi:uncharacterized protein [Mytilus edulis]|uniref:uncharacterized protein n=1 Tax=Mytilus edulis TaxID=6550 RepID=UPI0039F02FBC
MASAAHVCGICDLRHVTKPSVAWCPECDEGFCSDCEEHHSLSKATRHHKTMKIAEYQTLPQDVLQITQSCTKHNEKLILYCRDHETPCCGKCVNEGHKGCNKVVNLDDIVKNAKTSTSFQEIEETLVELLDNIKEIQNTYKENLTNLSESRNQIEKQIQDIRSKIDTHLNTIQKKLIDAVNKVEETEIKKVRLLVKTLEEKENHLTKYQNSIANIKQHASDLQTFMSIRQIEQDLSKNNEFIQSCVNGDAVNTRIITCSIDKSIETITRSVQRFGEIAVVVRPTKAALRDRKKTQAQMIIPQLPTKSIDNVTALLQQTIKTTSKNVRGCCILPDGRLALTCSDRDMLILIKADGCKDFEMQLPGAFDVTNGTRDNILIVSSNIKKKGLSIIDIKIRAITKFIPIKYKCYGVVVHNDNVIFCTESELKILNLQTESINTITNENMSEFSCVDTNGKYIYYTALYEDSVTCCDFKGVIQWTFTDKKNIISPRGIALNDDGFVFVSSTNLVVLISPCGKQYKRFITNSDKLRFTQALHYDKKRDILLVANREENAFVYKVGLK